MKKVFLFCMAMCLATTLAFAQKITNKDLQGNWKLAAFDASGIRLDLKTQDVTISPDLAAQLTPEAVTGIKEGMKQAVAPLSTSFVNFTGTNNVSLSIAGDTQAGTYTLAEKDGKQHLAVKKADGTTAELPVAMKDKQLYVTLSQQGQQADFIFGKQ